ADVTPFCWGERVRAGATARRLAVVAVRHDQARDAESVEERHGAKALRAGRAAAVHRDHPHVAVAGGEQPRGARTERRADQLGRERDLQILGAVEVPAAERRVARYASLRADVREELALDAHRVL